MIYQVATEISIEETQNEYLLYIPPNQKERARGIEGRRWDPKRRSWVYPRNVRMYNALVAEFGNDLTSSSSFTSPQFSHEKERREKVDEEKVELQSDKESEIQLLKAEVQQNEQENGELKKQITQLKAENSRLPSKTNTPPVDRVQLVKDIALETTGNNPVFGETIRKLQIDENLPIAICRIIENHLKRVLNSSGSLYDLIMQCRDAAMLEEDDIGLAHSIRKQRNIVAHHEDIDEDERTKMGRSYFCLFAASLLFPKLPEDESANGNENLTDRFS
jgi:hypothetical protein